MGPADEQPHSSDDESTKDSTIPEAAGLEWHLNEAIRKNHRDELEELLDHRDDILDIPLQHKLSEYRDTKTLKIPPLSLAAILGQTSIVELLLEHNANVSAETPNLGGTALHLAARCSSKELVELLLNKGADVGQKDDDGHLPFHLASLYGRKKTLQILLERGSKEHVNEPIKKLNAPLHLASRNGHCDTAEWLLDSGAVIDQSGQDGVTPLHLACSYGRSKVVEMLIRRGANIHKRDDTLCSPIHYACEFGHEKVCRILHKNGASVSDIDANHDTCLHMAVKYVTKFSEAYKCLLRDLVEAGVNINQPNINRDTPLMCACTKKKFKTVELLLDLGADINWGGSDGVTALMETCSKSDDSKVAQILLDRGADATIISNAGSCAMGQACKYNRIEIVRTFIRKKVPITFCDKAKPGRTPLLIAVQNSSMDVALEILGTPVYFPPNPAREKAFTERSVSKASVEEIEDGLLKNFKKIDDPEHEQLPIILHWAIANDAPKLAERCISRNPHLLRWKRDGATWYHVAAQYGQHSLIQRLQSAVEKSRTSDEEISLHEIDILAIAKGNITALHVAAADGNVNTTKYLLGMIPKQSLKVAAILYQNSQGESPLTLSINRRRRDLENLFWDEIRKLGTTDKDYMRSSPGEASRILELLAKYEAPGRETVLEELLKLWFVDEKPEVQQDFTTLHWAVHRSQAVLVWWLLSKGGYSSGYALESARKLVPGPYENTDVRSHIRELLIHPPPFLAQVANPNDDEIASKPKLMDESNPALNIQGNIMDIYTAGEMVSIPYTKASIRDIIYNKGPEALMRNSRENWDQRDLDDLKRKLEPPVYDQDKEISSLCSSKNETPHYSSQQDAADCEERLDGVTRVFKLRWIHLPFNELHLMGDLVCRLSYDSKRLEIDHNALMKQFNRSWTELAAGGKRSYMKPQCTRKEIDHNNRLSDDLSRSRPEGERITCMALYMPYLSLGSYNSKTRTDENVEHGEGINSRNSRRVKHKPMTIDQYYYPTIADTDKRDNDQVLSKFLKQEEQDEKTVLMVNQLWIWIIDEKTIITATTEDSNEEYASYLLKNTLDNILYGESRSQFERATSVQSVVELVLEVATGSFTEKFIPIPHPTQQIEKKGPIEIYRESIRNVADHETQLFQDFLEGLRNEAKAQGELRPDSSWLTSRAEKKARNRYHIISSETELLEKIRDMRDELHILRSLAEDQDDVWKQAISHDHQRARLPYQNSCTPSDVKEDIDEMLLEAEKTTDYINSLLDLRQAEYSRVQANDSARQSNIIFIFTIITIIFLPLSFLSSLFALDVSNFPHDPDSGMLKYQGWWIFPIMFGVTLAVSGPVILIAWNVNDISEWLRLWNQRGLKEKSAPPPEAKHDILAQLTQARNLGGQLKRRWRERHKDALPRHERH
ncbi:uncharacterized protein F4822DRAFT_435048 [Hypoxylon trugodes]|uniref:uncharacterized protein n=1 Tax=Hypoxylon trugodes TaxID=326681 RepID=UPI0021937015|nr:uncharacterized protein F4822DRAFT_435048 [Hypoxylon trugodes]KAI1383116.1 hypothetical protein F4822DRAFT_435048 [Hypoxylon trugodes]